MKIKIKVWKFFHDPSLVEALWIDNDKEIGWHLMQCANISYRHNEGPVYFEDWLTKSRGE